MFSDTEKGWRDGVLSFFEAHRAVTVKPLMDFIETILGVHFHDAAAVEHHPDAADAADAARRGAADAARRGAADAARLGKEPASVLLHGFRFKCASKVPNVTGSETITAGDLLRGFEGVRRTLSRQTPRSSRVSTSRRARFERDARDVTRDDRYTRHETVPIA